jgi:hypothetical protein
VSGNRLTPIPRSWVEPIQQLVALVKEYGSLPRAIGAIISLYIVNSVLNFGTYVVESILLLFSYITGSLAYVQAAVGVNFAALGTAILTAIWSVQMQIVNTVNPYGPFAPVVLIGVTAIEALLAWRFIVALAGELPLGSSIVDFLGLR